MKILILLIGGIVEALLITYTPNFWQWVFIAVIAIVPLLLLLITRRK